MPVQILISPPACGKTQAVISQVLAAVRHEPLAPVWVVIPDQLQASHFRRRLAHAGGAMGVRVGTFGSLYQEFLDRAGRPVPVAPDAVTYRLIQAAIDGVFERGQLDYYQKLRAMPGFALELRDLFAEFKRALVDPQALLEIAQERQPSFQELARIYDRYQARLHALNWADSEGLSWLAVETLENDPSLGSDLRLVVVDGFDSFTAAQLKTLELLGQRVAEITITLPGSPDMRRPAHRRFAQELNKLRDALRPEIRSAESGTYLPEALAGLERSIFETDPVPVPDEGQITMIEARNQSEEAREALRWLKARMIRDGLKANECALVVPDHETYRTYLKLAGREFGLDLRFTLREPLTATPPAALLIDLLELPLRNYSRRLLLDTLRSPYLDLYRFDLGLPQVDALEVASLAGQVVDGLEQWFETLDDLAKAQPGEPIDMDENELRAPDMPTGMQAAVLRASLDRFAARLAPPMDRLSMAEWVHWLQELLEDLGFLQNPELERDQAVRATLEGTFRALGMSSDLAGSQSISYSAFVAELQGALQGATLEAIPEKTSPIRPAIIVLRILEARGVRYQAVAVLGLAEGIYPQPERADPFLGESDRLKFGLEPRLGRQQAGIFYQAVTRSDRFLLLTRPYLAPDGESWEPSPYWNETRKLLPDTARRLVRPDDLRPLEEAASVHELLFWAANAPARHGRGMLASGQEFLESWQVLDHARSVLEARIARAADGPYEGKPEELQETLDKRFGSQALWSASRLETYGSCPFRFYVEVALGLQARQPPQLGIDASQLGSLLHEILERVYQQAVDPGDPDAVLERLDEVAKEAFRMAPTTYGFRPSVLWGKQQEYLLAALEKTIRENAVYDPAWRPVFCEIRFGSGDQPALLIQTSQGPVYLRGVIDRIDRNQNGELRVVDYKTGGSHLAASDLVQGTRLQLPLYALAAEKALKLGKVAEGLYWKILKAEPGALKLATFAYDDAYQGIEGAFALAEEHVDRVVGGVRSAQYPPEPPKGGCPSYCAAASWCWRYSPATY